MSRQGNYEMKVHAMQDKLDRIWTFLRFGRNISGKETIHTFSMKHHRIITELAKQGYKSKHVKIINYGNYI